MIIELSDEFRIDRDKYNHTLEVYKEVTNNKTKEVNIKWVIVGHYATLEQCINSASSYKVLNENTQLKFEEYLKLLNVHNEVFYKKVSV
tara:strand:- start:1695 stop:1961 length:267 start_codon:yes stop_codon:yes gene_type:complete